jgi:hypothetical protein
MAGDHLIDAYLGRLASRLPADTVDELADGLLETWHGHLDAGLTPENAARQTIREFGTPDRIADEFVAQAPGRRTARLLLLTGPVMGACWGGSLVAMRVWTWSVPPLAAAVYAGLLIAVVCLLLLAATSRHSYRRTRLGGLGAVGLILLDLAMIAAVSWLAPTMVWLVGVAMAASVARVCLAVHSVRAALTG